MSTVLLVVARAFHFGSGMILVGVVAFRWLVLLPSFTREPDETWLKFAPLFHKLTAVFIGAYALLILSGLFLFWSVTSEMSGTSLTESLTPDTLSTVLFQTQFGSVCQWRLGFAAILGLMIWRLGRNRWLTRRKSSLLELSAGLVASALIISIAWTGHAAATGGADFKWRVLADATHLFAASIWPTGLLPFALFLYEARHIHDIACSQPILKAVNRFSNLSFLTVGVLLTTGIINTCFVVGSFPALIATDYGRLLCLKLLLFVAILCVAAWNRYRLVPDLFTKANENSIHPLLRRLQTFVMTEFGLAIAVFIVVGLLGITPPPR